MISYDEALALIHCSIKQSSLIERSTETLSLDKTLGKVAARQVNSPIQSPPFRNSAMDGFAVCSSHLKEASPLTPVILSVTASIAAGDASIATGNNLAILSKEGTVQIMTGAPVPLPFDAVVPIEKATQEKNRYATFTHPVLPGEHVRMPGEDVAQGECVLKVGSCITPEHIMLLSSLGITSLEVAKTPLIRVISTGNEITDDYSSPLKEGQIYNANAPYLMAALRRQGLQGIYDGMIEDDACLFEEKIASLNPNQIIISTGAVSKGIWDFIPHSLEKLGATIHFHRVNIRPGKPILFATLPNGSFYFGLPGNPISAAIGFNFFIMPLIRTLQGLEVEQPINARLTHSFTKKSDFRQFLKSTLSVNEKGVLMVDISQGQESFKIHPLAKSNAWVVLDENTTQWQEGDCVTVYPYFNLMNSLANPPNLDHKPERMH